VASKAGEGIAVAVFNVNREGRRIEDSLTLDMLPFKVERGEYAYYKVFKNECGLLKTNGKLDFSLGELDVEVVTLAPVKNGKAVIGLKEYILPSALVRVLETVNGKILVKAEASGTLIYYANGAFNEVEVKEGSIVGVS
jgi:hypothetical protein